MVRVIPWSLTGFAWPTTYCWTMVYIEKWRSIVLIRPLKKKWPNSIRTTTFGSLDPFAPTIWENTTNKCRDEVQRNRNYFPHKFLWSLHIQDWSTHLSSGSCLMLMTSVSSQMPPYLCSSANLARSLVWDTGQELASTRPELHSEARGEEVNSEAREMWSTWHHSSDTGI